ncbi:hypothetical protein F2Q69_00057286 [Brassica cretica]|uniref:Uncharacterized protein n=1 Tax=Brassica cretica TaxID=69181 RepID=A0A8S9MW69_BRACR|nr:hypothetical protein F2Q69_00057286 [Brassica cretica]
MVSCSWSEDAVVGRNGAVKTFRLLGFFSERRRLPQLCRCRPLSPGGGGFHSSVVAGSRLREIWFRRVRSRSETKLFDMKTVIQEHNGFGGGSTFCELQSSEAAVVCSGDDGGVLMPRSSGLSVGPLAC